MSAFRHRIVGTIQTSQGYDHGEVKPPLEVPTVFYASIQPLNSSDAKNGAVFLPEGVTIDQAVRVYSDTELPVAGDGSNARTVFAWRGQVFELVRRDAWQNAVIPHYRYLAARQGSEAKP